MNVCSLTRLSFFFFWDLIRDFSDRDPWSDFRFSLTYSSLSESRHSSAWSFVSKPSFRIINLNKFCFCKIWLRSRLVERSCFLSPFDFRCFVRFESFCELEFLSWTFWLDHLFEFYLCIRWVLIVCLLFVCEDHPDCAACYFGTLGLADHEQGK